MIVVDASVLAPALIDDTGVGDGIRSVLAGEALAAPELIDLEVMSVVRRHVAALLLPEARAAQALSDLGDASLVRSPHVPLLPRCWELRENVSPYDAAYVALAELLDVVLLTGDERLAGAPGPRCHIELVTGR